MFQLLVVLLQNKKENCVFKQLICRRVLNKMTRNPYWNSGQKCHIRCEKNLPFHLSALFCWRNSWISCWITWRCSSKLALSDPKRLAPVYHLSINTLILYKWALSLALVSPSFFVSHFTHSYKLQIIFPFKNSPEAAWKLPYYHRQFTLSNRLLWCSLYGLSCPWRHWAYITRLKTDYQWKKAGGNLIWGLGSTQQWKNSVRMAE